MATPRWLPLESNPTSFNAWSQDLGLDTDKFSFQDCYGLDSEVLSWVAKPVKVCNCLLLLSSAILRRQDG